MWKWISILPFAKSRAGVELLLLLLSSSNGGVATWDWKSWVRALERAVWLLVLEEVEEME